MREAAKSFTVEGDFLVASSVEAPGVKVKHPRINQQPSTHNRKLMDHYDSPDNIRKISPLITKFM